MNDIVALVVRLTPSDATSVAIMMRIGLVPVPNDSTVLARAISDIPPWMVAIAWFAWLSCLSLYLLKSALQVLQQGELELHGFR